ncbi:FAD-binding oxidoreductase [Streptacidiphilus pinicola]|uniref:D-amino-acid oxidase n=1 Tax=Streptacidiphilus pinicola TaxID=2219663 RepID=A0A2X0K052_9ACTN|nr:FAD-dependent oxidoreductase [Streptacidiphilus pinicola]RAG80879.1 FAD-binding oxidoreductase [Streptacidiphilus pinicola]
MSANSEVGRPDVVIVGAGVIGLTTAVVLAEAGLAVRVDAERPPGATTSVAAGATWGPFLIGPEQRVDGWARSSRPVFEELAERTEETGVALIWGSHQSMTPTEPPRWAVAAGARLCTGTELRPGYVFGWRLRAPVIEMPRYLAWLEQRLARAGGLMRNHRYGSLAEAAGEAPVVVNCSGIGAATLVPDPKVVPVRGQAVLVRHSGELREFFGDDTPGAPELIYAFPHGNTAVLGGTTQRGDESLEPSAATTETIVRNCLRVLPELRGAEVLETRVGLRPTRDQVRLEAEESPGGLLVHNYGHGGAGVTVSWGCAAEVLDLVKQAGPPGL